MAENILAPIVGPTTPAPNTPVNPVDNSTQPQTGLSAFVQQINTGVPQKPTVTPAFQQTQSVPVVEQQSNKDLTTYRPYVDNPDPQDPNLDLKRAQGQGGVEQLLHGVGQFGENVLGGVLGAFGSNFDIKQAVGVINGSVQDYGNAFTDASKALSQDAQERFPIYETDPGKFNPADPGWWASQISGAGSMVGMAAEAIGETAAVTAATEGTGTFEEIGNIAKRLASFDGLKDLIGLGTNSARMQASAGLFATINRHNMSMMSASQAGQEEYDSLKAKGYSDDQAHQFAAKAASATYFSQMPLLALDYLGFKAMTFNPLTGAAEGGLADSIVDNLFGHITNPLLKTAALVGAESAKGSFEGMWQQLASQEGKSYADRLATGAPNNTGERLMGDLSDPELWNAGASGFIGGAVTGGIFKGYEHLTQGSAKNAMDSEYQTFVNGMASTSADLASKINIADQAGNEQESNNLRRQLGINKALSAIHMDQLKGQNDALSSYKGYFNDVLDAAKQSSNGDSTALEAMGMQGHEDFLQQNVPQYLADADKIKAIYDDAKENNKRDAVIPVTYRRFLLDTLNDHLSDVNSRISAQEGSLPDLSNLSSTGRELYQEQMNSKYNNEERANIQEQLKDPSLQPEDKEALQHALDHNGMKLAMSQKAIDDANTNDDRTGIEKSTDNEIMTSLDNHYGLQKLNEEKASVESAIDTTRKQLNIWQSKDFQSKKKQDQINDIIQNTDTVAGLDRAKNSLQQQDLLTDETAQTLEQKRKDLSAKEETVSLKNKSNQNDAPINRFFQEQAPKPEPNQQQPSDAVNPFGRTKNPTDADLNKPAALSDIRKDLAKKTFDIGNNVGAEVKSNSKINNDRIIYDKSGDKWKVFNTKSNGELEAENLDNPHSPTGTFTEGQYTITDPKPVFPPKVSGNATIIKEDTALFDPAKINTNKLTDEVKSGIAEKMASYIASLKKDLGKEPSFVDLLEDFVNHTSKDQVEKNFNVLKLGWQLNDKKADFEAAYNEVFGDRKAKGLGLFDLGSQVITDETELANNNEILATKQQEKQADKAQFEITDTGGRVFKPLNMYQTATPTLKMAHLSMPYIKTMSDNEAGETEIAYHNSGELNNGEYVDSKALMNPDKYAPGTKMDIKIPNAADADKMLIAQWDKQWNPVKAVPFGEWAKGKDKGSDEYISRMPMLIHDKDGTPRAFVHDMEWYNPTNVAFADDRIQQAKIIQDSRKELLELRKQVLAEGGKLEVTITDKRPGTKYTIPEKEPLQTIEQAAPQARIGYVNDLGNIVTGKDSINFEDLVNKEDLQRGHQYDVRQVGLNADGKPTYFASKMLYDKIDSNAKMSVIQALKTYASQNDTGERLSSKSDTNTIRKDVLAHTGLDLFDKSDLEKYLNMFIPTVRDKATDEKDVYNNVESNPNITNGTPFVSIQKGSVVFGIKGMNIDGKNTVNYFYPGMFKGDNPDRAASMISASLQRMYRDDFLGKMSQNMDGDALESNRNVAHILYDNDTKKTSVVPDTDYQSYLKGRLKTNIKSFDLGDGSYATFIQPVINYTYDKASINDSGDTQSPTSKSAASDIIAKVTKEMTGIEPKTDDIAKSISNIAASLEDFKTLGLPDDIMNTLQSLGKKEGDADYDPNYQNVTDEMVANVKNKLSKIDDLDTIDRGHIVGFIANEVMNKIDPQKRNTIAKSELMKDVNSSFENIIKPKTDLIDQRIGDLQSVYDTGNYPKLKGVIDAFNAIKDNAEILKKNWNYLINEAFEDYISKFTGISIVMNKAQDNIDVEIKDPDEPQETVQHESDEQDLHIEANDERTQNYSKETIEDNGKNSVNYLLKRFLAQMPSYDKAGNEKKGFMGVTVYPGFDYYYDAIGKMLTARGDTISDFDDMMTRLSSFSDGQPWVSEAVKRLQGADEQLKNAFMYNFKRDGLSMKFVMYSYDTKTNNYKLKVYDTNANEILRVIQNGWRENFKQSPLVVTNGENYEINPKKAQDLLDQFTKWNDTKKLPQLAEAQGWLSQFGINLSKDTMQELINKGYFVNEGKKKDTPYPYSKMFSKSGSTNGIFGALAKTLEQMTKTDNRDFQSNDSINPFENVSGILNKLANIESKYSTNITTNSFRDGSKSIFGYTPSKFATDFVNRLKTDPEVIKAKGQISFDRYSYVLNLLANDADFNSKFGIDHIGINAFKELGKKLYQDNTITSLSDADHELVKLGLFQDLQQGEVKSLTAEGLSLRMAKMFLPTMSDKSQMLDINTAVLDLKPKDIDVATDTMSDDVKHFLFSQLIDPEMQRIISHHAQAIKGNSDPNFLMNEKGYNMAAQIFHFIPEMNNMMYTQENGEKMRLIEFLAHAAPDINPKVYDEIKNKIQADSYDLLGNMFKTLVADKTKSWEDNGYVTRDAEGNIDDIKFLDNKYLAARPGSEEDKVKMAAYDFVVNSVVTNANMHMLLAGDIANFSQDKAFKEGFEKDENNNPIPYKPLDDSIYSKIEKDVIGVNLGKRLAMLLAPGASLAQSKGDKYVQLFAKDRISASDNMKFLIGLYHGDDAAAKASQLVEDLRSGDDKVVETATKALAKKYPDLSAYLAIESTDAQEYTTAKEALDIQFRQGRMSTDLYKEMNDKLVAQSAYSKRGEAIPPELFLSDKDLQLIFQPHKPVVTGQMNDVENDMSRMMYIKSSAFALIPQVTQAFPDLDNIRKGMEDVQDKTGQNVRLSYDTANKVGAPLSSNQLDLWDNEGKYNEGAIDGQRIADDLKNRIAGSALLMDRDNFRIQQDVPFKSTKIDHQDMTTLGTQMMKEMFGDGVGQIDDKIFDYNGEKVSGRELQNIVNQHFDGWIRNEKSVLYDQLGIDEATGQPIDIAKTTQKLQGLLQNEAKKRDYPKQDIDALEVSNIRNAQGEVTDSQFTIPLWLSPNSNRYEALLNAIVSNRMLDLKLPGASYVAGSPEGYRNNIGGDVKLDDGTQPPSKTIFTDKWKGSLQPASFHEDGSLKKAQVLVPSKFRDNEGKLLDLFSKKNGEYTYVTEKNGNFSLKEDMIDDLLKSSTSFRIPTSSHVSMSQIDIAGFLPPEAGDLMIVPKNFTKQKGLDFDVDKENMYSLHHTIDENGKIIPIEKAGTNLDNYDEDYNDLKEGISHYQDKVSGNLELSKLINQYKDEIEVADQMGFNPADAKKFIKQLKTEIDPNFKKSELKDLFKVQKGLRDLKSKLYQNEIAKSYSSVLGNQDPRIQQKINKVLSTDFAEDQANILDTMVNKNTDNKYFTTLSDEYQKDKMGLGAAGKMGIGVYSNYVVFHSLVQQADKPIRLMKMIYDEDAEKMVRVPYNIQIGDIKSDGLLGRIQTLDGSRSITDVNAERQNTATDNEKLQIMGKTNVNELTINVDATLSALGFDKGHAEINGEKQDISVPYFLLSQPIIRDYVEQMRNVRSNIADYNPNAELDVINNLNSKYSNNGSFDPTDENQLKEERAKMTGQKLADNIQDEGHDGVNQQAILHLFREVKEYGDTITGLQSKTNIQRNGLGKSIFEMIDKYNNVAKLQNTGLIQNTDRLIGDYITGDDFYNHDLDELRSQGYAIFSDPTADTLPFAVKPLTVTGSLVVHSAKSGYELWNHYFPHKDPVVSKMIDDAIALYGNADKSDAKRLQLQHEVFDEMKKYLYSSDKLGLFKGNPQDERKRLFMDSKDNESLATYLNKYVKSNHENVDLVANNKLINRFQYQLEKGILPSIIKYDNTKSEDFNEEYKYQALVELADKNAPLADYNGQPYSTRMLAKDLINYHYLRGGIQEAIEYGKYIPVPLLKELGFSDATQLWQRAANGELFVDQQGNQINLMSSIFGTNTKDLESTEYPRFLQQLAQHNPGRLAKFTDENIDPKGREYDGKKLLSNLTRFVPKDTEETKPYISIYNKDIKLKNKFQVYKFDGEAYNRIPTLGAFGMDEYSIKDNYVSPLIDKGRDLPPSGLTDSIKQDKNIQEHFYDIDKGNIAKTLKSISEDHLTGLSEVADKLLPYLNNNIKLELGDVNEGRSRGLYRGGTIMLDNTYLADPNTTKQMIASTVIHEAVHALTSDRLNNYFDKQGNPKVPIDEMPSDINRMARLYREVTKQMGPELEEFKEWYANNPGQVRDANDRFNYAGMNVHEFTAMIMSEPDIQQKMAGLKYLESGKTLLDQFKEVIKKVLNSLGIKFDENSVTAQGIDSAFQIIDTNHKEQNSEPSNYLSSFGKVINPSGDEHIEGLIDKSDLSDKSNDEDGFHPDMSPEERKNLEPDCIF